MPATRESCAARLRFLLLLTGMMCLLLFPACAGKSTASIPPPTATSADISIALDRSTYNSHQPLGVTVTNAGKKSYYAKDGLSACTYLQLEYYDPSKKAWLSVDACSRPYAQHELLLASGASLPYTLAPGDSSSDPNAWVPGVYRVSLTYTTAADGSGTPIVVYSAGATITS